MSEKVYQISLLADQIAEAVDLAAGWFIKSRKLKDEDKEIALLYYNKTQKKIQILAKKLEKLCQY